jgi:hypothetical protein
VEIADANDKSTKLLLGIEKIIENASKNVAVYLNTEISLLYWTIENFITTEMQYETYSKSGQKTIATLSQTLSEKFGKGYSYSGINRMINVAEIYNEEKFATLSRTFRRNEK